MKHFFPGLVICVSFILVFVFIHANTAVAKSPFERQFGGIILETRAVPIRALESTGFVCPVPGISITIKPVGAYPTNYLIPTAVRSKTGYPPASSQWILGNYSSSVTAITCTNTETGATTSVELHPVTLFGTSKPSLAGMAGSIIRTVGSAGIGSVVK